MPRLDPLGWNIPIVDERGRPVPEFLKKWNQQAGVNATIPELSTADQVSAILDKIGGTAGDMLRRGATVWEVIAAVGGTDKFLRADGTWAQPPQQTVDESEINLTDVLTNNVSATRHGFAPKLPNDATKFLDGSGQWSTPAGGGGGSGGNWCWLTEVATSGWGSSGSAHATKGQLISLDVDLAISEVIFSISPSVGHIYHASIAILDSSNNVISVVESSAWTATATRRFNIPFSVSKSASKAEKLAVTLSREDGTGTSVNQGYWGSGSSILRWPMTCLGFLTLDKVNVEVGDTFSLDSTFADPASAIKCSF